MGLVAAALVLLLILADRGEAATAPPLDTAQSLAVLAGAGITNTGPTTINGDVGTFPTTTQTGLGSVTVNGADHGGDAGTRGILSPLFRVGRRVTLAVFRRNAAVTPAGPGSPQDSYREGPQ